MATTTYVPIANYTFAAENSSYTFSSIPSTYSDLIVVVRGKITTGLNTITARYNGDTGSNYYYTRIYSGDTDDVIRTDSTSGADTYAGWGIIGSTEFTTHILQINNYTQTSKGKTGLGRSFAQDYSNYMSAHTNYWNNTSAINSITISNSSAYNFAIGTTFALYGIADASIGAPKATGGIITQDSTYFYHTFGASGTFTPQQNLTNVDYLVIAGGGGGSASGAGAGGLRTTVGSNTGGGGTVESKISLTSGTAYTITVGAGGTGSSNGQTTAGSNGGDSSIAGTGLTTITAIGGGAGTPGGAYAVNGINGGSGSGGFVGGGGVGQVGYGGSGTANQGYAGGNTSVGESSQSSTGSGGGAGGPGQVGTKLVGATGGVGMSIPDIANATGTGVATYYAGGGGSAIYDTGNTAGAGGLGGGGNAASNTVAGSSGVVNTGGGAGGYYSSNYYTAAYKGGSGLVVIRYAKA